MNWGYRKLGITAVTAETKNEPQHNITQAYTNSKLKHQVQGSDNAQTSGALPNKKIILNAQEAVKNVTKYRENGKRD
jgi:hypothetical protein